MILVTYALGALIFAGLLGLVTLLSKD
ncbi:potassium transporter KtrB [Mesobaculum littorinae]|uniref:Potassium transporter KtrB n=1 Tax=Mesobaculum littorinae TaxID=2486419 RepID=A0A438AD61_9RHOB|nr:potassium transporter KtrB [Mesobaculum littorinae]